MKPLMSLALVAVLQLSAAGQSDGGRVKRGSGRQAEYPPIIVYPGLKLLRVLRKEEGLAARRRALRRQRRRRVRVHRVGMAVQGLEGRGLPRVSG